MVAKQRSVATNLPRHGQRNNLAWELPALDSLALNKPISGRINWWMIAVGALVTVAALAGSRLIWKWGIGNYAVAST